MALDTYANLKTSIESWLDRDDLVDQIDDFIAIAEARHKNEVRFRKMLTRATVTVVSRYVPLPTGYLQAKNFRLLTDPVTVLDSITEHEMSRRRRETTDKPTLFTTHVDIEVDVVPDIAYSGEMLYYQELQPLGSTNPTNALLDRSPDIYLYSALSAAAPFLMNDERVALWETLYTNSRDALALADNQVIGPVASRVSGSTP